MSVEGRESIPMTTPEEDFKKKVDRYAGEMEAVSESHQGVDSDFVRDYQDRKRAEVRQDLVEKVRRGQENVPDDISQEVQNSSRDFWSALDEYVAGLREARSVQAPSRNEHIAQALRRLKEQNSGYADSNAGTILEAYVAGEWDKRFDYEAERRGISPELVDKMLRGDFVPDTYQQPTPEKQ